MEQLRRFQACFSPEQMLVLIYDDFREDNQETVRRVLRFLAVEDSLEVQSRDANPPSAYARRSCTDWCAPPVSGRGTCGKGREVLDQGHHSATAAPRGDGSRQPAGPLRRSGPADAQLVHELRLRFAGEVLALSEHLERDLTALWGYERLD